MKAPHQFWEKAAEYIKQNTASKCLRRQLAVRQRVQLYLAKQFKTVGEAEEKYGLTVASYLNGDHFQQQASVENTSPLQIVKNAFNKLNKIEKASLLNEWTLQMKGSEETLIKLMPKERRLSIADLLVKEIAAEQGIISVLGNFVTLSLSAMKRLQNVGKNN